jgi:hypothetical protein
MMMNEHAYGVAGKPECETKPLETVASIAEDAERAATLISAFIVRFRHGNSGDASKAAQLAPVPSGHAGQIDRLRAAVFEIDRLARELGTLG